MMESINDVGDAVVLVVLVVGVEKSIRPRAGQCSGCTRWRGQSCGRAGVVATSSERRERQWRVRNLTGLAVTLATSDESKRGVER